MIIGHIATGLLVQALAANRLGPKAIPSWITVFGSTLNDILIGLFIILGIERVKSNPSLTPLGLEFPFADYSHSWSMIVIWGIIYAYLCSYLVMKNKTIAGNTTSNTVWFYGFLSVVVHILADWLVHIPDMAIYPNSKIKLGAKLWANSPILAWGLELLMLLLALAAIYYYYGSSITIPAVLLTSMHLMNFPGAKTNIPYMLGTMFTGNALRFTVGFAFILTYLLPGLYLCSKLDNSTTIRRSSIKAQ